MDIYKKVCNMQLLTELEGKIVVLSHPRTNPLPEDVRSFGRMPDRLIDECFVMFFNVFS